MIRHPCIISLYQSGLAMVLLMAEWNVGHSAKSLKAAVAPCRHAFCDEVGASSMDTDMRYGQSGDDLKEQTGSSYLTVHSE